MTDWIREHDKLFWLGFFFIAVGVAVVVDKYMGWKYGGRPTKPDRDCQDGGSQSDFPGTW